MHIWYVHHYGGGPGVGSYDRPYQLARAWKNQGHSATVFIAGFHHLLERGVVPAPDFEVDGVRYVGVPARPYAGNGPSRLLNMWDFTRNLYAAGRRYGQDVPRPDAVIASSPHPFAIFPAHRLARRHGAKLVFEIRDLWPLSITEILGVSRLHPFVQMCAFAERFALRRSDLVASVLPRADRYLAERGYGHRPFLWVPNGIGVRPESGSIPGEESRQALAVVEKWRQEGRTVIVHAGALGKPNAVDLLLDAVGHGLSTGEAGDCRVLLLGSGQEQDTLKTLARQKGIEGVYFSGRLPKRDIAAILEGADIGYGGVRTHDALYRYGVSLNKFSDYFQAGLPVLLPIAPCGDPVSESGGGIARRAETPEAVWEALRELLHLSPAERRATGEKGRAYMARAYDYDGIARRYIEAIRQ